jgi:hypothetical protein
MVVMMELLIVIHFQVQANKVSRDPFSPFSSLCTPLPHFSDHSLFVLQIDLKNVKLG